MEKESEEKIFEEEDFTEDGHERMYEVFGCLEEHIENKEMPLHNKIRERRWLEDYIAQYEHFYNLENRDMN